MLINLLNCLKLTSLFEIVTNGINFWILQAFAFVEKWENLQNWAALPGAFNIPDIKAFSPFGHYYITDWSEIIRKEIHPLYNSNDHRYNVAVVQLKNKLKFGPESRYNPICLPQCDHVCKTRTGLIEHDLVGKTVVVSRTPFEIRCLSICKKKNIMQKKQRKKDMLLKGF